MKSKKKLLVEGVKFDEDKIRFDLLNWAALWEIAEVMTYGAKKYDARNWEKGMKWGRLSGGLFRHVAAWAMGQDYDPETGYRHLAHAGCCVLMLMGVTVEYPEHDDRSKQFAAATAALGQPVTE